MAHCESAKLAQLEVGHLHQRVPAPNFLDLPSLTFRESQQLLVIQVSEVTSK